MPLLFKNISLVLSLFVFLVSSGPSIIELYCMWLMMMFTLFVYIWQFLLVAFSIALLDGI